jgi:histidinol-phosphatase (PHP family)
LRIDLHSHTTLCNHASGTTEEFVKRAIELGIDYFGFSDHAPAKNGFDPKYRMDISQKDGYERDVLDLREKYKKDINILLGYEVDFLDGDYIYDEIIKNKNIDYIIGSVHFIPQNDCKYSIFNHNFWGFDNPEFIDQYEDKDIDKIWEDYFEAIKMLARSGKFDIVGHLDLIKVFNFLPKKDIKQIASEAIKEIKKSGMVVELNPAGLRKKAKEQYPSRQLLEMCYESSIDITFGSDAHTPEQIGFGYDEVTSLAKEIGYKKCTLFTQRDRKSIEF